jgi:orotate phosphoribosyltransferase
LQPGTRVALIEDVVTSGGAALSALDILRTAGADVRKIVAVVDREEGGTAALADTGVEYKALFTSRDLGIEPSAAPAGGPSPEH